MGERREVYGWTLKALLFVLSSLLVLELLFRFAVPADQRPASAQIQGTWVTAFDRSYDSTGHTSIGRVPLESFHWTINPQGWNSTRSYITAEARERPLIVLIGDSHVENLQSDVEQSMEAHLQSSLGDSCLVYSFGKADQSLLQDLLVMRYVDSLYRPDAFVIVVGGDVIHRSIMPGPSMVYAYMQPADDGFVLRPPAERTPSDFARQALRSSLVRYLRFNMAQEIFPLYHIDPAARNHNENLSRERVNELMEPAARYILDRMSREFGDRGVLITSNYFIQRYRIYGGVKAWLVRDLDTPPDYHLLEELVPEYPAVGWLDTESAFARAWERDGRRFECPDDKHLNGYGNEVVAEAILERLRRDGTMQRLLGRQGRAD